MFKNFKLLPLGIQRILITGVFLTPFIVANTVRWDVVEYMIASEIIYVISAFTLAWIYAGFKK